MDWFLYDNGLRHERVNLYSSWNYQKAIGFQMISEGIEVN